MSPSRTGRPEHGEAARLLVLHQRERQFARLPLAGNAAEAGLRCGGKPVLLYNVVATPGALYQYWRQHQTGGHLALTLIAGTLPGVIAGSVIRVELLPGPHLFDLVVSGSAAARNLAGRHPARATPRSGAAMP